MSNNTSNPLENGSAAATLFAIHAGMFTATLTLALLAAHRITAAFAPQGGVPPMTETASPLQLLGSFVIATVVIVALPFLVKRKRVAGWLFRALFLIAVSFGSMLLLTLLVPSLWSLLAVVVLVGLWFTVPNAIIHNLLVGFAIAGVTATIGVQLMPLTVVVLLVLFSIYDFIAVYKTKHMVKMAHSMAASGAVLGFIAGPSWEAMTSQVTEKEVGGRYLLLGGGDIAFPALLAVATLPQALWGAVLVGLFALLGLGGVLLLIKRSRRAMPALPPIAFASIAGYLVYRIVMHLAI